MHKKAWLIAGAVIALVAVLVVPGWCAFDAFLKIDNAQDLQAGSNVNPKMVLKFTNLPVESTGVSGRFDKHAKLENRSDILQGAADLCRGIQGVENVQLDKNAGTITLLFANNLTHSQINHLCEEIQQRFKPQGINLSFQMPAGWSWGEGK